MAIEVGAILTGKVAGITKFGAFVELLEERKTGLVHISEVAENYVSDISKHLTVGDTVQVKVLSVESAGKISLSIKKAKVTTAGQKGKYGDNKQKNSSFAKLTSPESFDQKMSKFLKDSEDRLSSLKKNTETKRGGRGGRRG